VHAYFLCSDHLQQKVRKNQLSVHSWTIFSISMYIAKLGNFDKSLKIKEVIS
jgi:aspartokinase-like uncharacterized kinase